jgi:hypothetical protein
MASKESQEIGDLRRSISNRMASNPGIDILSRRAMLKAAPLWAAAK